MSHMSSRYGGALAGFALAGLLSVSACQQQQITVEQLERESQQLSTDGIAHARLQDANGVEVARVTFQKHLVGSQVQITGLGLPTGIHAFHVHANNDATNGDGCIAPTFASADGHYNPAGASHPNHAGDMPVVFFTQGQTSFIGSPTFGFASFITSNFTPDEVKGKAVILHALADNCANIPTRYSAAGVAGPDATTLSTGDAGGRLACGVITD
jgi:Cu-Zn family superoxide dismutase